jgi:hypothetical protein
MPHIEVIKASEAPTQAATKSKIADQLITALMSIRKDQVLKLTPDEGKSLRGVKTSVGRVMTNANIKVNT